MQDNAEFVCILNGIRTGENPNALNELVRRCSRPLLVVNGIVPTILYPR